MSGHKDVIHIACQADERFAPDCAVMLHSLIRANPGETFDVHFLHGPEMPAQALDHLRQVTEGGGSRWSPLVMTRERLGEFPFMNRYGGLTAWYRIFLPHLLPELPKILYLDADLMILRPIRELWDTPLADQCLAAVHNPLFDWMRPRIEAELKMPSTEYFNSGVMLLNLAEIRRRKLDEEVIAFVREKRAPMPWADQEPLNAVLWRHRVKLHPRWNTINGLFDLPARYMPWDVATIREATSAPCIIHFIGEHKPWHYRLRHPYRAQYFAHLAQTPFKTRAIVGKTFRNVLLRPLPVLWAWTIDKYWDRYLGRLENFWTRGWRKLARLWAG